MRIRLLKMNRIGKRLYRPGDVVDVNDATGDDRVARAVAVDLDNETVQADTAADDEDDAPDDVADAENTDEVDDEPDETTTNDNPDRPLKAAKLEAWQSYARSQGVDPKGMKKDEIIARFI